MPEVKNFIEEYLRLLAHAESPDRYLYWGAISCLSTALRDNIYLDKSFISQKIYPNMYVLILGDTSNIRKSTPFDVNTDLLLKLKNSKVMIGQGTLQAVLESLSQTANGQPMGGSGCIISSEATSFLISDQQTMGTLCDMYTYKHTFEKRLVRYNEVLTIKNLCFSMFLGTNEAMIQELLDQRGKEGGFLGRCIIIREEKRRHRDSGYRENVHYTQAHEWEPMVTFLRKLSTIIGPVKFTPDAEKAFDEWYNDWEFEKFYTKTGYEGRLQTHVEKIAMILAASKHTFDKVIEKEDFENALKLCMDLIPEYKRLTFGTGASPNSNFTIKVTEALLKSKQFHATRQELLIKTFGNLSGQQLDEITKDLVDAGFAVEKSKNGMPGYQLTQKFIEIVAHKQQEKSKQNGTGTTT